MDEVTESDVLAFAAERIAQRRPAQIATVNAEFVMHARRDSSFLDVLRVCDLRTPDGFGVVLAARRRGLSIGGRVGGSDLIWSLSEQASRLNHRIFLLGARPGIAKQAADRLASRFPDLVVAGTYPGSPYPPDDASQIRLIQEARPDVLFVAFGAPQQDLWIARVKEQLAVPVIMGVGGSFDYVAGAARRAPRWMRDSGFDWLFRLVRQPWRWQRMLVLPQFAFLAMVRSD